MHYTKNQSCHPGLRKYPKIENQNISSSYNTKPYKSGAQQLFSLCKNYRIQNSSIIILFKEGDLRAI